MQPTDGSQPPDRPPGTAGEEPATSAVPGFPAPQERGRTKLSPVAWRGDTALTPAQWRAQGRPLGLTSRSASWWLGDWLRFGRKRFHVSYETAAGITGYDAQTLTNMAYVASRIEISRRREKLSWSIHAELAPLEPDEQEHWLKLAESTHLSVRSLRTQLRQHKASLAQETKSDDATPESEARTITCPHCGAVINL